MEEYLKRQLIAYIGNKRALLPFLTTVLRSESPSPGVFLDPFAGTGAVSRLARSLGYEVQSNDWETYAWVMNQAFLTLTPASAEALFAARGGLAATLRGYNSLATPAREVIARHYAPRDTNHPEPHERLFYTRENALFLDAVRQQIEQDYGPSFTPAKTLLVALLVYEASVHSNTSGVFKAFHRGFGGHNGDALGRILAPMSLEYPALHDSPARAEVQSVDATLFLTGRTGEVCYLDPPYNQHQYGSNYHLLNTVARGDEPPAPKTAGIRPDWTATRSEFCSRVTVARALGQLLDQVDARRLVVSYNTEGLLPFDALYETLDQRGEVSLAVQDYVTYRGGRQSPQRQSHNLEFVLVVETRRAPRSGRKAEVDRFLTEKRLTNLAKGRYVPSRLRKAFSGHGTTLQVHDGTVETDRLHTILATPAWSELPLSDLMEWERGLSSALCSSPAEESQVLVELRSQVTGGPALRALDRRLLLVLRKLAFAKYRDDFLGLVDRVRAQTSQDTDAGLSRGLDNLEALFQRRIFPR